MKVLNKLYVSMSILVFATLFFSYRLFILAHLEQPKVIGSSPDGKVVVTYTKDGDCSYLLIADENCTDRIRRIVNQAGKIVDERRFSTIDYAGFRNTGVPDQYEWYEDAVALIFDSRGRTSISVHSLSDELALSTARVDEIKEGLRWKYKFTDYPYFLEEGHVKPLQAEYRLYSNRPVTTEDKENYDPAEESFPYGDYLAIFKLNGRVRTSIYDGMKYSNNFMKKICPHPINIRTIATEASAGDGFITFEYRCRDN